MSTSQLLIFKNGCSFFIGMSAHPIGSSNTNLKARGPANLKCSFILEIVSTNLPGMAVTETSGPLAERANESSFANASLLLSTRIAEVERVTPRFCKPNLHVRRVSMARANEESA